MTKIAINRCFGGFGLSHEAVMRYFEIKGITVYPEKGTWNFWTYWTVKPEDRPETKENDAFYAMSLEDRQAHNKAHSDSSIYERGIARDDPALIQVIEEMGDAASGDCADLSIVEVPDGVNWEIDEYDGREHVAEVHRTWG